MKHGKAITGGSTILMVFFAVFVTGAVLGGSAATNESVTLQDIEHNLTTAEQEAMGNLTDAQEEANVVGSGALEVSKVKMKYAFATAEWGAGFGYQFPTAAKLLADLSPFILAGWAGTLIYKNVAPLLRRRGGM